MDMRTQLRDAILDELNRQADEGKLTVDTTDDDLRVVLHGSVDIDALAVAIEGAVAGGP